MAVARGLVLCGAEFTPVSQPMSTASSDGESSWLAGAASLHPITQAVNEQLLPVTTNR